jgi:hypothetical protein
VVGRLAGVGTRQSYSTPMRPLLAFGMWPPSFSRLVRATPVAAAFISSSIFVAVEVRPLGDGLYFTRGFRRRRS